MKIHRRIALVLVGVGLLVLAGCGKVPPPLTEAEGVVLLDGKPLPSALITFQPDLADFGAEMNSTAITDAKGYYQLVCSRNQEPGACVGKHRVVVIDAPPPEEARSMSGAGQALLNKYLRGLQNRPIPEAYQTVGKTPLIVTVEAGQKTYNLNLTRR